MDRSRVSQNLPTGSAISDAAELDPLRNGLLMSVQLNIQGIVIEFDACYESNLFI